jgi:ribosome-associated toxin RatA of RatAB toxin-antitoxin module
MSKPYTVTRTTTINAPAQRVHALVNDIHEWPQWSPWEGLDPQMRRTYSGPDAGVGAAYAWEGNRKAGKGDMTLTGDAPDGVDVALHFEKPFKQHTRIAFVLTPVDEATTTVEWRMDGELNGIMRVFSVVKSMDSLIGPDFEKGLAQLKRVAESG